MDDVNVYIMDVYNFDIYPHDRRAKRTCVLIHTWWGFYIVVYRLNTDVLIVLQTTVGNTSLQKLVRGSLASRRCISNNLLAY